MSLESVLVIGAAVGKFALGLVEDKIKSDRNAEIAAENRRKQATEAARRASLTPEERMAEDIEQLRRESSEENEALREEIRSLKSRLD